MTTPLRQVKPLRVEADVRVLAELDAQYSDGREGFVHEIVSGANDRSSMSDELVSLATNEIDRYHLAPARSAILRSLPLGGHLSVLEVGAGCGAVTRYLGERCRLVDAIEPVMDRARITHIRTSDLPNVQVFCASIDDLPSRAAYDMIAVIGVLEYAGGGTPDPEPYVRFLTQLSQCLKPDGFLVCAIENQLGVKYLAGSPEDHTGRIFDSLERYPKGSHARTFSRYQLENIFRSSGFRTEFLHVFPDYKFARAVIPDATLHDQQHQSLAWQLPHFPSYDVAGARPRLVDEGRLWRTFVESDLGGHFANSFLVAAHKRDRPVWPVEVAAVYFAAERRAPFCTRTVVRRSGTNLVLARYRLLDDASEHRCGQLLFRAQTRPYVPGTTILERLVLATDSWERDALLRRWYDVVSAAIPKTPAGPVPIDLMARNVVLTKSGDAEAIDQEWWHDEYTFEDVISRGLLLTALDFYDLAPPDQHPAETLAATAIQFGCAVGLQGDDWLARAVEREAQLLTDIELRSGPDYEAHLRIHHERLRERLTRTPAGSPLGMREHELRAIYASAVAARDARLAEYTTSRIYRTAGTVRRVVSVLRSGLSRR